MQSIRSYTAALPIHWSRKSKPQLHECQPHEDSLKGTAAKHNFIGSKLEEPGAWKDSKGTPSSRLVCSSFPTASRAVIPANTEAFCQCFHILIKYIISLESQCQGQSSQCLYRQQA